MKHCFAIIALCILLLSGAFAQVDILGSHDLQRVAGSTIHGNLSACLYCHAPHSGNGARALWSQTLSTQTNYTLYPGTTNPVNQPTYGSVSNQCLSCHDGTVAPGQTTPYGKIQMTGGMASNDIFQSDLSGVHPFNFTLPLQQDASGDLVQPLLDGTGTLNPAVKLIDRNVQCTSCHEPHNQFIDSSNMFLVVDNSSSSQTASALCLACHTSTPTGTMTASTSGTSITIPMSMASHAATSMAARPGSGTEKSLLRNTMTAWKQSSHAMSTARTKRGSVVGGRGSMARNGCSSCHAMHTGAKGTMLLIQSPANNTVSIDASTRNCLACHDGSDTVSPTPPNVLAEINKGGHPLPNGSNAHQTGEKALLDNNRHATCVDCHNPHSSKKTESFVTATIRPSQNNMTGVSEGDGTTVEQPAQFQYQTCLRCHGASEGKRTLTQFGYAPNFAVTSGDPLNVLAQFGTKAKSSHPVMHDRNSALAQPSLLSSMIKLDGRTLGRPMGSRIMCSDCHSSDDSRESGGTGPSGPHGSSYPHILERRYEMSQVATAAGPGTAIQNLFPNPNLDASCASQPCVSPYALCAKCHDLTKLSSGESFSEHARHINDGFSCSVCHSGHGVPSGTPAVSGERLVNFDVNVVAPYNNQAITYNRASNTCSLVCHNHAHSAKGSTVLPKAVIR